MKVFSTLLCITGLVLSVTIQSSAADTLKVHLTYKHKLNGNGQPDSYVTINQRFYTLEDVLFREINYDENTSQIKNYTFYFYKNNRLFTEECYSQTDSLQYILRHDYDAAGHETEVIRLRPVSGNLVPVGKTVKSYDGNGRMISQKEYAGKKASVIIKYQYDGKGKILRETMKNKGQEGNPLKTEQKDYNYDLSGTLSTVQISGIGKDNKAFQYQETYAYNEQGRVTSIRSSGTAQVPVPEKSFKYLGTGAPGSYQEIDANGTVQLMLQYDYKKYYMDRGTQVSFLEGKN